MQTGESESRSWPPREPAVYHLIAEPVPARRLYDWGFINRLVAKDSLMDAAMEMAERIADVAYVVRIGEQEATVTSPAGSLQTVVIEPAPTG